ncbi:MAG: hypothetical protein U9O83_02870, partial [Campylobacterota bacterium]|nr:hypothetical protein [Campylobacterota bacterium]
MNSVVKILQDEVLDEIFNERPGLESDWEQLSLCKDILPSGFEPNERFKVQSLSGLKHIATHKFQKLFELVKRFSL